MSEPIIEFRGVSKAFGSNLILDKMDLKIYRGESVVVLGPSGTGKSTILRLVAGLLAPDAGEIYIGGQKRGLLEEGEDALGVRMVFQQAALFDSLTVEENVGFALMRNSRLPAQRIKELVREKLATVGMEDAAGRLPAELSGGMRKRVSFARAILTDPDDPADKPEILLYDEPTAGLDPMTSTVVEDVIRQLHSPDGCSTYMIVTHQESTIQRTAQRLIFMYKGKVQWDGKRDDAFVSDNPYLRQFFEASIEGPVPVAS
ncbi:MAG: ATP-binding cassette domain-containing protein [Cyanobacteria bacterium P01_H01_bin.15]